MKTILVPTDFSEIAANAINYAAKLAMYTKSKLLLFHVYQVPMLVTEVPFAITSEDIQLEEKSNEQLELIMEELQKKYENKLEVDSVTLPGYTSSEIVDIAKDKKCDLIIMGTNGAHGSSRLLGSNTTSVIKHTQCNVLVIPDKVKFQKIDKIAFACDYHSIKNSSVFDPLLELATLFNSEIMILNIEDSRIHPTPEKAIEGIKLERVFENTKHTFWFSEHKNIIEAINEFAANNHAVMITMIRRSHNLFQQILTKSNTKLMASDPQLPLLILHEQIEK